MTTLEAPTVDSGPSLLPERARSEYHRWHLLRVRSRQEKALAAFLEQNGVDCYLPLARQVRYHGRRKVLVELPIFPGYLFLWGTADEAFVADRSGRVASLIRVEDQETLEKELEDIRRALSGDMPVTPVRTIPRGTRVFVRAGPFRGLEGIVDRHKSRVRLVLKVSMLGSAASLEIDESLLEPTG